MTVVKLVFLSLVATLSFRATPATDCTPAARKVLSEESKQRLQTVITTATKDVYITLHEGPLLHALRRIHDLGNIRGVSITKPDAYADAVYKKKKGLSLTSRPYILDRKVKYNQGLIFHRGSFIVPFTVDGRFPSEITSQHMLYGHLHWDHETGRTNILGLYARSSEKHPHLYQVNGYSWPDDFTLVPLYRRQHNFTIGTEFAAVKDYQCYNDRTTRYYSRFKPYPFPSWVKNGKFIQHIPVVEPRLGFQTLTREESEMAIDFRVDAQDSP